MKYSLMSREIISDSIECMIEAHQFDAMVMIPGCGLAHAVSSKKAQIAKQSGKHIVEMINENLTPRKIMPRECLRNAIAAGMAMGASTNSTLHIPAIAHEANLDVTIADFDEISRKVPYICNIKPSGAHPLCDLDEAGGIPAVLKAIESKLDTGVMTVTGKTLGENLSDVQLAENDVIFPLSSPNKDEGGLVILHGNIVPDCAVIKKMYYFDGRAIFSSYKAAAGGSIGAVKEGDKS